MRETVWESRERRLRAERRQEERRQCLTYRKLWWLCMSMWIFTIVGAMVGIVHVLKTQPNILSVHLAKPTNEEGYRRMAYIQTDSADFCSLPIRMSMQPTCGAVALIAPDGVGSSLLRTYVEIATRLTTGSDKCMMSKTLHVTMAEGVRPLFAGECTDALYAKHHALVRFTSSEHVDAMPGYEPTRYLYMWRHPLEAALSAFAKYLYCDDIWRLDCLDRVPTPKDLDGPKWPMFFEAYSHSLARHYNESLVRRNALVVDYEEFGDRENVMTKVINHITPVVPLPSMPRMMRCISRTEDDRSKRHIDLSKDRALYRYAYGDQRATLVTMAKSLFGGFKGRSWVW